MENRKILMVTWPFDMRQQLYVYENGNKLEITTAKMDELPDVLFNLIDKYKVTKVEIKGSKPLNKGLVKKFKEYELNKYSNNDINFVLI